MRKTYLLVMIMMLGIVIHTTAQQEPIRLMRYPGVGNGKIAFTYQGDLWLVEQTGGCARRLTVHYGNEEGPIFSPDGKWIAFTGNYYLGKINVFIMPVDGGRPKQLTYHPNGSWASGWTPDSKYVIFGSWGRTEFPCSYLELYKVSIDGGYPEKLPVDAGSYCSFSPDWRKIAFNRHNTDCTRKRYRGSRNRDVWIYDLEDKTYEQITTYDGNDSSPMWGKDNKIYFVSDRNGIANIFAYSLEDKKIQQITGHTDDGVKHPSISPDGRLIVYENNGRLYLLDTVSKTTEEVVVYAPTDDRFDMVEYVDPRKCMEHIEGVGISPSGKRMHFAARGDIFTAPAKTGDIRNLTQSSGTRERRPRWSPDGNCIAYVSDVSGEQEIYIVDQEGKNEPIQLTDNGKVKKLLKWSPDGEKLLYRSNDYRIYMVDVKDKQTVEVAYVGVHKLYQYNWSPDGKWIAYVFTERNKNSDIYLYSVEESRSYPFIIGPTDDYGPGFTPDGKTLVFMSEPFLEIKEIHSISLMPEEEEPYQKEEDEEKTKKQVNGEAEGSEEEEKEEIIVEIDFENVMDRVRVVPIGKGNPDMLGVTKDHYYFLSPVPEPGSDGQAEGTRKALYAFNVKEAKTEKIADNVSSRYYIRDKKIFIRDGDKFQLIEAGKKDGGKTVFELDGLTMKLDRQAEWKQIFHEAWRVVRDYFYDENYHGVDWEAVREHYASLLPYVRTRTELNALMHEMLGELNSSHEGVRGGDDPSPRKQYSVAMLGAQLEPDYEAGYYRFARIYKGDKTVQHLRSPLDADYVGIKEGDYLLAINGQTIPATENYLKYLVNQHQSHLTLTTNSVPSVEGAIETRIKPITNQSGEYSLRYKEWVDRNTRLVDELSDSRIGYFHLGGTTDWIPDFRKYLEAYRYREGIIIDVRYNPGGEEIEFIDMLDRHLSSITRMRDSVPRERPADIFAGKVVVLCNEYSACAVEMFLSAVKARKLGTVIGKKTCGCTLGPRKHRFIDGGIIYTGETGVWGVDGTQLEGKGFVPDIIVENRPEDEVKGKDPQLEKAISYLVEEIKKSPRDYDYPTPIEER